MTTRRASHAGSWYTSDSKLLSTQIDNWLSNVHSVINNVPLPIPYARVIIAPHAGYTYSGSVAAYAYAALSVTLATKRIFILGPSHTLFLTRCALTTHSQYATPIGNLIIDTTTVDALHATGKFDKMPLDTDNSEHSLEMHLPYIHKVVSRVFDSPDLYPQLVPILVGNTSSAAEREYGTLLAPYLADPSNIFIISSDFCHWGLRFGYSYYLPDGSDKDEGYAVSETNYSPSSPSIHESIEKLDQFVIDAIESGSHKNYLENLRSTENTVCGRHPIGIIMVAMEVLEKIVGDAEVEEEEEEEEEEAAKTFNLSSESTRKRRFKFIRYEQSSKVVNSRDSSVSYASAYAVI